jgi:mono/diheme cytochrome c family protein
MAGGVVLLKSGVISFRADAPPSAPETKLANMALNASVAHHASNQANPYPPTEENLLRGLNLYRVGCSECHGVPRQKNPYGAAFYPPVPQFPTHPPHRSEAEIYYIVKYGVRNTGMAAWGSTLNDEQIWKLAAFLNRIDQLPPSVTPEWNKP